MIYLDSAATTFQKPPEVVKAVADAFQTMGSPGRGGYTAAMKAAETAFACRSELAELYHAESPEQVVFTMNATHGLNLAIKSLVPPGGKVLISGYEHNAVTRPLKALNARVSVAKGKLFDQESVAMAFERQITGDLNAVICNHVSNVFGFVQPVERIAEICRMRKIPLIIDASQSAGVLILDLQALDAAFIAMPGHKGLYGPQGTGVLLCGRNAPYHSLIEGGTGSQSLRQDMPKFLPDALEAGTHNMPGIAGLLAGVRFLKRERIPEICQRERELALLTAEELRRLSGVCVYAKPGLAFQTGVVSFTVKGWDVETVAKRLADHGIAVRAGLHCAPLAHQSAGTLDSGTIRVSFSYGNTDKDVRDFLAVLKGEIS